MGMRENDKELLKKYLSDQEDATPGREEDSALVDQILSTAQQWKVEEEEDVEGALKDFKERLPSPKKETKVVPLQIFLRVAAVLVIGIGIAFFFYNTAEHVIHSTAQGERSRVTLPDQSSVYLDAESILSYQADEWPEERALQLTGKAFFDVREGSDFVVTSDKGTVTVLGTSFTINDRADDYYVECYTGKVAVGNQSTREVITAGEKVTLLQTELSRSTISVDENQEWVSGKLHFERAELVAVFEEIERQYGISLEIDPLGELFYSGSLDINQSVEDNLEKVCLIMGLQLENKDGTFVISPDTSL